MNITLIDFRNNPGLRRELEAAARRDRARQLGALLGRALARLSARLSAQEPAHAPRTHLARQG